MHRLVSDEVKSVTTKCRFKFECLNNEKWRNCAIEEELHCGGVVIKEKCPQRFCSYFLYYGDVHYFCICPTRREIYQQYKV